MEHKVYLTKRNLLSLLSKLDRKAKGEDTQCTIIKYDTIHKKYPQTMHSCRVEAVEHETKVVDEFWVFLGRADINHILASIDKPIKTKMKFPFNAADSITVYSVADEEYYTDRDPGPVHVKDDPSRKV